MREKRSCRTSQHAGFTTRAVGSELTNLEDIQLDKPSGEESPWELPTRFWDEDKPGELVSVRGQDGGVLANDRGEEELSDGGEEDERGQDACSPRDGL
jgi:hypothetical protein